LFYSLERCGSNMNKKSNIIKIVKEDILRIFLKKKLKFPFLLSVKRLKNLKEKD